MCGVCECDSLSSLGVYVIIIIIIFGVKRSVPVVAACPVRFVRDFTARFAARTDFSQFFRCRPLPAAGTRC